MLNKVIFHGSRPGKPIVLIFIIFFAELIIHRISNNNYLSSIFLFLMRAMASSRTLAAAGFIDIFA